MKHDYSMNALDNAIGKILPQYSVCKENGIETNRPSWMKMVAEDYFIKYEGCNCEDWKLSLAYYVVRCAMLQLHEEGCITFGDREIEV